MVRMVSVLLSLLLLVGPAVPQETRDGHYSLTYLYTGLSRSGKGTHRLQGTVFLNGRAFFHYNSEDRKAEPLGPWRHVEGVEDWEKQSQVQKAREDIFMETLNNIMEYYNDGNGKVWL
nr:zinc-alpha-2-glycoprotein-like isoform X3 [Pan troglodytes]